MQLAILILLILVLMITACLLAFAVYIFKMLIAIADKLDADAPFVEEYRRKREEAQKDEEKNRQFDKMLKELSEKKSISYGAERMPTEVYDELDSFDAVEKTENEPESLMALLEFGLPDEEMASILDQINSEV